jgi:hypothetical protein
MGERQSLAKLNQIIDEDINARRQIFYRNSFALCCYLVTQGETRAAKKQLKILFDILGWDRRKIYFWDIIDSIDDFAVEYAGEICANLEINKLFIAYV